MDPARTTTGADARYWQAVAEGRIELPRCAGCGRWHWPAVWRCGDCGSWEHNWVEVAPRGTIYAWTRTFHPFGGLEDLARPFVSIIVALDEAPARLMGLLDADGDTQVAIGDRVVGRPGETRFAGDTLTAMHWHLAEPKGAR